MLVQEYDGLRILEETADSSCYAFGFAKGDPVAAEFSRVILQMKDNGQIRSIVEKWTDGKGESVPEQTWPGKNGTLTCVVSPTIEPVCYRNDDGNLCSVCRYPFAAGRKARPPSLPLLSYEMRHPEMSV